MKNIKLRYQIVIWTVALEAVLLLVFAAVFVAFLKNSQNQQNEQILRLSAAQLNAVVDIQNGKFHVSAAETADIRTRGVMAWVLTPDGLPSLTIGNAENYPLPSNLPKSEQTLDGILSNNEPVRILVAPLSEGNQTLGALVLALPLHASQALLQQTYIGLAIAIPFVILLSALGGLFLARRALQPVSSITQTAQQISAADLSQRLDLDLPDDEIGQLAETFNDMLERLDHAFQRERQFNSDASHELRTPLSFLKTQLSLARSKRRETAALLEMMAEMEDDVDRMTRLVEQMLALARVEQHGVDSFTSIDLVALLTDLASHFAEKAQQNSIKLNIAIPAQVDFSISGDEEHLRQVFINLIENAIKYTPSGGQVNLGAKRNWEKIKITVANSGEPIPAEHLPHLFERFYRIQNSRSRDSGGAGLGLAISRQIVQRHGGDIQVQSEQESGTVFTILLPVTLR